ncbi:MAG TPA: hypothetical protein VE981_00105 [Planctomycetota bacterium]|nr:hypothetical protein [Planctomycetota bacterium]
MFIVVPAVLAVLLAQDPADQLRRQELALRLSELADAEKLDGFARAVIRELKATRTDAPMFDQCWRPVARRRWGDRAEALIAAWDNAASDPPSPGQLLFRARLETLANRPGPCRDRMEAAALQFPDDPVLLLYLGRARFEGGAPGPAASALEHMAAKGPVSDPEEFHRLLFQCYAQTDRPLAAIEHLRAVKHEDADAVDLARLALKNKVPLEAARLYRIALRAEPERSSLRIGIITALNASGEYAEAAAERTRMFDVDGRFSPERMHDYFFLLPQEGRAEEIVRTFRSLTAVPQDTLCSHVPPECRTAVLAEWEKSAADGRDWALLARMKRAWSKAADAMDCVREGEKRFPDNVWILRQKIDAAQEAQEWAIVGDTYLKLSELDPGGRITGAPPFGSVNEALQFLGPRDAAKSLDIALRLLQEPGMDEESLKKTRAFLKSGWEASSPEYWAHLKKASLRKPRKDEEQKLRGQIHRLSSDEFADRDDASAQLRKAGLPAVSVLLPSIDDPDAEVQGRVRDVIRAILMGD